MSNAIDPRWIRSEVIAHLYRWHTDYGVTSYWAMPTDENRETWTVIAERVDAGRRTIIGKYRNLGETSVNAIRRDVESYTFDHEWNGNAR